MLSRRFSVPWIAAAVLVTSPAAAAHATVAFSNGKGEQVARNAVPKPLHLDAAQREQIRTALLNEHTEVEFRLKSTRKAKDFTPAIGVKLPKGVKPNGMPEKLLMQMPQIRDYGYVKMKGQVLIVNAMTGKIVDVFPESAPAG